MFDINVGHLAKTGCSHQTFSSVIGLIKKKLYDVSCRAGRIHPAIAQPCHAYNRRCTSACACSMIYLVPTSSLNMTLRNAAIFRSSGTFIYASVVFPIGIFVVVTFWGLYAVDRELVFPAALDASYIPPWLNHVMHTTVLLFLVLEKFLVYHDYPSRSKVLSAAIGFTLLYQVWILWMAFYADLWVYPVLKLLGWPMRLVFFAVPWGLIKGEKLSSVIWKPQQVRLQAQKIQ